MKKLAVILMLLSSASYAGNCDYPWQTDSIGRSCGGRSAASRPGGYEPPGSSMYRSRTTPIYGTKPQFGSRAPNLQGPSRYLKQPNCTVLGGCSYD